MSKQPELPERLQAAGATDLERRLLEAASREQPSRELSERMAQAIGISLIAPTTITSSNVEPGATTGSAVNTSSSLVPWISGALVATCIAVGAYVATRPTKQSVPTMASVALAPSASSTPPPSAARDSAATEVSSSQPTVPGAGEESPGRTLAQQRGHRGSSASELANQIALVDSARKALAAGDAQRALSSVREYQSEYPNGTFRPEVAAVKIEALIKIGRTAEARALAERFVVTYGPGPLAERVARLAHLED